MCAHVACNHICLPNKRTHLAYLVRAANCCTRGLLHAGSSGTGSGDRGSDKNSSSGASVVDRPANVEFVQIAHAGWVYLGVVSTAAIAAGEELLLSYDDGYWATQRQMRRDICHLNRVCESAGHRADEDGRVQVKGSNWRAHFCSRAFTCITTACDWLGDLAHVGLLWWRAWTEDAGFAATARQELANEEARLGFG